MLKPAFSTVACPEWTLKQVADNALAFGFEAVELRTFGDASRNFACDPAMSSDTKVRDLFLNRGIEVLSLATGLRFDEPIWPPVIGLFTDRAEVPVREAKRAVDLAVGIECPFVRVFGFEQPGKDSRSAALKRISDRLKMVVDHADKSGVRIVVENGGSFSTSEQLMELIARVAHPLLGASYCNATAALVGEDPAKGVEILGDRLWVARIKDARDGRPVALGQGTLECEKFAKALVASGFDGPLVFEWDRAWMPDLAPADQVLKDAARTMFTWLGAKSAGASVDGRKPAAARH